MRKKLLSAIAAVAAGSAATAQVPGAALPPPMPIAPAAMSSAPDIMPANGAPLPAGLPAGYNDPNQLFPAGPGGPAGPGMGMDPAMGGMPGYPPGYHGQQMWADPFGGGIDPQGINSRLAPKVWLNTDYMLAFVKSQPTRYPLVVTSAPAAGGILGATSTTVLHSLSDLGYNLFSGARFDGGWWRDEGRRFGFNIGGFFLEEKSNIYRIASDGTGQPLLARPFVNAATNQPDVLLASFPNFAAGSVEISTSSTSWGAEGGPITNLYRSCPDELCLWNVNLLTGFRYLEVREDLRMNTASVILPGQAVAFDGKIYGEGSQILVSDIFETRNSFYGGQIGLNTEMRLNRWVLNTTAKVALGVMNERIDINGFSVLGGPNATDVSVARAGLFANSTNVGRYNEDRFAVVPEVNVNLGYTWRSWLTTSIGYNFLYVSRVARPGDQFSEVVNPANVPTSPNFGLGGGIATPNPLGTQSDFWIQGVNFTVTIRY